MSKKIQITLGIIFIFVFAISFVVADSYELYCLGNGEQIDFGALCNPAMRKITGPANICVHILDNGKICSTLINTCNNLGLGCSSAGNHSQYDTIPPQLNIQYPSEGEKYYSRSVLFSVSTDEKASVYYTNLNDVRERWSRVCGDCTSYVGKRSFDEGENKLMVRAEDSSGNKAYKNISFFIDSKKPQILKTLPKSDFADGNFDLEFKEENPRNVVLYYGTKEKTLNINTDCTKDKTKYYCNTYVDLGEYNGQKINYWFAVEDIANNRVESKRVAIDVDTTLPVLNNPDSFWRKEGNKIYFNMSITEMNFDEITYIDANDLRPRELTICSSLRNGVCSKSRSFRIGNHNLTIYIKDEAGNVLAVPLSFTV